MTRTTTYTVTCDGCGRGADLGDRSSLPDHRQDEPIAGWFVLMERQPRSPYRDKHDFCGWTCLARFVAAGLDASRTNTDAP